MTPTAEEETADSECINSECVKQRIEGVLGEVGPYLVISECQVIGIQTSEWDMSTADQLMNSLVCTLTSIFGETYARSVVLHCFSPPKP